MNNKLYSLIAVLLTMVFFIGFHNVDLCRNEQKLECMFNEINTEKITILESTSFKTISLDRCYIIGLDLMSISFIFMVILGIYNKK